MLGRTLGRTLSRALSRALSRGQRRSRPSPAHRHCRHCLRRRRRSGRVLEARGQAPAPRLGAAACAVRGAPGDAVDGGDDRPRAGGPGAALGPRPGRRRDRAPPAMAVKTSATYAEARSTNMTSANALAKAGQDWTGGRFEGEQAEEVHQLVWGEAAALDILLAEQPHPGEHGPGWPADEATRFGVLSRRLWERLLAAGTLGRV